jgi:thioesterase domain-containing protein
VPAIFIAVTSFPLTLHGKLDLKALPAPDFTINTTFVAPRNENERVLAEIWHELFDRESISVNDNFFDLGGHSLLGTELMAMMKDRLNAALPMRILFEAPTIALLAARLSDNGAAALSDPIYPPALVPIQPTGKQDPLFFLMASGEEASLLSYSKLFRHVGRDQPTIGILPPRKDASGHSLDVKEMAAESVRQIRTFKPEGPYRLVGYCAGGIVIYEIAQQLRQAGQHVDLVLIDTVYPIHVPEHLGRLNRRFVSHYFGRLQHHLKALLTKSHGERVGYVTGRARAIGNLVNERVGEGDGYLKAIGHYRPTPYDQPIRLLVTEDVSRVDPAMSWSKFAMGGLEIIKIPGDHVTCMREDAHFTAQHIRACLERDHSPVSSLAT